MAASATKGVQSTAPTCPSEGKGQSGKGQSAQFDAAVRDAKTAPAAADAPTPRPANDAAPGARTTKDAPAASSPTPGRLPAIAEGVPPARQQEIRDLVANRTDGDWHPFGRNSSDEVREALHNLPPAEQRYLLDQAFARWDGGGGGGWSNADNLASSTRADPALGGLVAERAAVRSLDAMDRARRDAAAGKDADDLTAAGARAAHTAYLAAAGDPSREGPQPGLVNLVGAMSPTQAGDFGKALAADNGITLAETLASLNAAPRMAATSAFVQGAFLGLAELDVARTQGIGSSVSGTLSQAIAREWYPDSPATVAKEAARLQGILGTDAGRSLLTRSFGDSSIPAEARMRALATFRAHPEITADTLKGGDGWTNPAVLTAMAEGSAAKFLALRGDGAQPTQGRQLDNIVGTAMGFRPQLPAGMTETEATAAAARGDLSYFRDGREGEAVGKVVQQIEATAGPNASVAVLPVQYSSDSTGPVQLPLFRVTGRDGREVLVANTGGRYDSVQHWLDKNELPPGLVVYPKDMHLSAGADGRPALASAQIHDGFGDKAKRVLDGAALVGGLVAGGLIIVGSGGTAAPIVGAVASGYLVASRSSEIADRAGRNQDINPFTDATARGLWLDVAANAVAVPAFGSAARLTQLKALNQTITPLEAMVTAGLNVGGNVVDAVAVGNSGATLATQWDQLKPEERATLGLSMAFWGVTTLVTTRGRPQDLFNPTAMRDRLLETMRPDAGIRLAQGDVTALAERSPQFRAMQARLEAEGWQVEFGARTGSGSFTDPIEKRIVLDPGLYANRPFNPVAELSHEFGHALGGAGPVAPAPGMTRAAFVDANLARMARSEGEATLANLAVRDEILTAGGPDIGVSGRQGAAYQAIYDRVRAGGDRDAAAREIGDLILRGDSPSGAPAQTYGEAYRDALNRAWAEEFGDAGRVPPDWTPRDATSFLLRGPGPGRPLPADDFHAPARQVIGDLRPGEVLTVPRSDGRVEPGWVVAEVDAANGQVTLASPPTPWNPFAQRLSKTFDATGMGALAQHNPALAQRLDAASADTIQSRIAALAPGQGLRLGREGDVAIYDAAVSRDHLTVTRGDDGSLRVADNGSANGTSLVTRDGRRIPLRPEGVNVGPGATVELGPNFRFTVPQPRAAATPRLFFTPDAQAASRQSLERYVDDAIAAGGQPDFYGLYATAKQPSAPTMPRGAFDAAVARLDDAAAANRVRVQKQGEHFHHYYFAATDRVTERVYVNASPDHTADLARAIMQERLRDPGAFDGLIGFKISGYDSLGQRPDSAVIYTAGGAGTDRAAQLMLRLRAQHPEWFQAEVPAFTAPVAPGIAIGAEPPGRGSQSFGSLRADAMAAAWARTPAGPAGTKDRDHLIAHFREELIGRGVDPDLPYRNVR
ncbi:DUF4781 domain-containing protein [Roseomonas sp. CCTCC AB2023176]|uniref:DUF4781 domain-containing protein n=1 Tax=Roseomonas sp. CCTCC AB2023176 TaxID=3342640 RepID=UPI0035D92D4C